MAGAAVVLWTATPPVIPDNDNSRPSLILNDYGEPVSHEQLFHANELMLVLLTYLL